MTEHNSIHLFLNAVRANGSVIAFIEGEKETSYAQLLQEVQATAAAYRLKGIGKGSKVLVAVPMSVQLYRTVLALFYIGACPVFIDQWVSVDRLKQCLEVVPCTAMVAPPKLLLVSTLLRSLRKIPVKINAAKRITALESIEPALVKEDETALVTFTTGSTGIPKAANRTHQFLKAQNAALQPLLSDGGQLSVTLLPIVVLLNLALGRTTVLPSSKVAVTKPAFAPVLEQLIMKHQLQSIIASPAITTALAERSLVSGVTTNSVQLVISGGGPLFPEDANSIIKAFPHALCVVVYGSTEAEPVSSINMKEVAAVTEQDMALKGLPVGKIANNTDLSIIPYVSSLIDPQPPSAWKTAQRPPFVIGEIVVSGDHVLKQYINNMEAWMRHKIQVGTVVWHRTGDAGLQDEEGRLYFWGRCEEAIIWKGQKLYPLITTWLIKRRASVREAALLLHKNKLVLVLENREKALKDVVQKTLQEMNLGDVELTFITTISKDPRHHTKVDYGKLKTKLPR